MNWINLYLQGIKGEVFKESNIEHTIGNLVNNFNSLSKSYGLSDIDFDKEDNEVVFPDCIIKYFISQNDNLYFYKLKKGTGDTLFEIYFLVEDGEIVCKETSNKIISSDFATMESAVNFAFKYLLFK